MTWHRLELEHWLLDRWRAADVPVARVLCEDPIARVQIREKLHGMSNRRCSRARPMRRRGAWTALTKCDYTRGPVILHFTISTDGRVGHIETETGAGAGCAATIIASNQFRAMAGPTDVTLSLGYK